MKGRDWGGGDGGRTGAWVQRGGWGVTGPRQQLTGLVAPGGERDRDSGLRLVRLLLRGPCPGAQAISSLEWSLQTGPQSWPQSPPFGCSCGPKESVHIAVLFFCFPSEDPPQATEGQGRWGEPGNRPAGTPGYRQAHSRTWMGPRGASITAHRVFSSSRLGTDPHLLSRTEAPRPLPICGSHGAWFSRLFTGKGNHRRQLRWPRSHFSPTPGKERRPNYIYSGRQTAQVRAW